MQPNETEIQETRSAFDPNSTLGTFIVALVLCVVCALIVSGSAVGLKPYQDANAKNKMMRNVLVAAGIWEAGKHTDADIPELFGNVDTIYWNLPSQEHPTGAANTELTDETFERLLASPQGTMEIDPAKDISGIKRRGTVAKIYLVRNPSGGVEKIILPISGKGLWSTLYGFLAVDASTTQARGITFYKHGETPGLGGEVENPAWRSKWSDANSPLEVRKVGGEPTLDITKPGNASLPNQVDGLSGATITSNGVENTIRYWLGADAFGPYLDLTAAKITTGAALEQAPGAGAAETNESAASTPLEAASPPI